MSARKAKKGQCMYCGEWGPVEDDHVPPQAIWKKPKPPDRIKVKACLKCHRGTSADDEVLAAAIALRAESARSPDAIDGMARFFRSLQKPEARRMTIGFLKSVREVQTRTPAGLVIPRTAFTVDLDRLASTVERYVRGLWAHHHGRPLPDGTEVSVFPFDAQADLDLEGARVLQEIVHGVASSEPHEIGDGIAFTYWFCPVEGFETGTAWLLLFHRSTWFVGLTLGPDARAAIPST